MQTPIVLLQMHIQGKAQHASPQDEEALETDECWQFTWPGPLPEDDPNGEDAACE